MARETKTHIAQSIFTSRHNANIQLKDRYEYVVVSREEASRHGYSRDDEGKYWVLNSIIADETGEYLRQPHFR